MTTRKDHYPRTWATTPSLPNIASRYPGCMVDGSAIRDAYGAADLGTRRGMPFVGQGFGIHTIDDTDSWGTAANPIAVTPATSSYSIDLEVPAAPTATRYHLVNGSVAGFDIRTDNAGVLSITFDRATLASAPGGLLNGKGRCRVDAIYDGTNQSLLLNGVVIVTNAVVPAALNGFFALGEHGTIRDAVVYSAQRTAAEARADYVREFARQIVWQWRPHKAIAAVATGTTGGDDEWWCPSGGATLSIDWITDLSRPYGGFFALTDSVAGTRRVEFPFTRQPYGTWLTRYRIRDRTATDLAVQLSVMRGDAPTATGYYWRAYTNAGNLQLVLAQAGVGIVNQAVALPADGTDHLLLVTHRMDGTWFVYHDGALVDSGVDTTVPTAGAILIQPEGGSGSAYVRDLTYFQGEMTPHELGVV